MPPSSTRSSSAESTSSASRHEFGVKSTPLATTSPSTSSTAPASSYAAPANWLLDLELAYGVFTADKTSMLQQELGLDDPRFDAGDRAAPEVLRRQRPEAGAGEASGRGDDADAPSRQDVPGLVKASGHKLTDITRELLAENAAGRRAKFDDLVDLRTRPVLLGRARPIYKYPSKTPTIDDFMLWMFSRAIEDFASDHPRRVPQHPHRLQQPALRRPQPGHDGDARHPRC